MSGRLRLGGASTQPAATRDSYASRDPYNLPPLPAQSLRPDPLAEVRRERAALTFSTVVLSLIFAIPMILAGIILHLR